VLFSPKPQLNVDMSCALLKTKYLKMYVVRAVAPLSEVAHRQTGGGASVGLFCALPEAIVSTRYFRLNNERIYDNWVCELWFRPDYSVVKMVIIIIVSKLCQWSHIGGVSAPSASHYLRSHQHHIAGNKITPPHTKPSTIKDQTNFHKTHRLLKFGFHLSTNLSCTNVVSQQRVHAERV